MSRLLAIGLSILAVAYLTTRLPLLQQPVEAEVAAARNLSPEVQRALAFGFKQVLSDAYWLQAVQYYGTKANEDVFYRGLYAILDRATTLDPHFDFAYQFGGEVIPYHQGEVGWHNTAKAIALLQKGMANQPGRWEIPFLLAYALFTYTGDYQQAGHYMEIAADLAEKRSKQGRSASPLLPTSDRSERGSWRRGATWKQPSSLRAGPQNEPVMRSRRRNTWIACARWSSSRLSCNSTKG